MAEDNDLLSVLNAHGNDFLNSFALPESTSKKRKRVPAAGPSVPIKAPKLDDEGSSEEEWTGFGGEIQDEEESDEEDDSGSEDDEDLVEDDGFTASSSAPAPNIVVFSDTSRASSSVPRPSKVQAKAFMSSKVSKLRIDVEESTEQDADEGKSSDERTNSQNDALLHRLVHTQLLSGSLNPELNLSGAQRKKAIAGRVLELAGAAKLGKGERFVRTKERDKAAKSVRDGMLEKQAERRGKQMQEAKDMGNYHPTIKKLFEDESEQASVRKRAKGLGMGIGKFDGGILKLSRREINSVNDIPARGRGRSRGRGVSRGRGGGGRGRGVSVGRDGGRDSGRRGGRGAGRGRGAR